jgi:hypothetical protein
MYLGQNDTLAAIKHIRAAKTRKKTKKPTPVPAGFKPISDPISEAVRGQILPLIQSIRAQVAKREPGAVGKLALKWTVLPTGAVANLTVLEDTVPSKTLKTSIFHLISRWRFPAIEAPREMQVPFVFAGPGGLGGAAPVAYGGKLGLIGLALAFVGVGIAVIWKK